MKKSFLLIAALLLTIAAAAQTLNVRTGNVIYQFPASADEMTFTGGTTLTVQNKTFTLSDITKMYVSSDAVTDNLVSVAYSDNEATVTVAGNIAPYITAEVSGAHVSITQSADVDATVGEITYALAGSSSDGGFYLSGSYKATVELNGLTLTNQSAIYSGAAIHIQNGKRIELSAKKGTVNTLTDVSGGSQKGCLYVKGHLELKGKGTLNIYANTKHGIKAGEYISMKNATINVLSAAGDGLSCNEYFLMESGTLSISGTADDGIQCDLDGTTSTGTTTGHEDEDSGNIYIVGGTISVSVTADAAKGIKAAGDIIVSGGTIVSNTSGGGTWDSTNLKTKAAAGMSADGNIVFEGGSYSSTNTGGGGKGISADGTLTVTAGTISITTSGGIVAYVNNTLSNNYTGNTDRLDSDYKSSPKGIKADGAIVISGGTITISSSSEGMESKSTITISGGEIYAKAADDAINSSDNMTIEGGYVCAYSTGNDGIDANGNCEIKGGVVYAIGASSPEVAIDANTEGGKKLTVSGGTIVALGPLESGSQLTQACYQASSWTANQWYALTDSSGNLLLAFKTPASTNGLGRSIVVSYASKPTLKSGVTLSNGTAYWDGLGNIGATVSGGTTINLSNYSSNSGGGPGTGGGPGGGWR